MEKGKVMPCFVTNMQILNFCFHYNKRKTVTTKVFTIPLQ